MIAILQVGPAVHEEMQTGSHLAEVANEMLPPLLANYALIKISCAGSASATNPTPPLTTPKMKEVDRVRIRK